MSIPFPGSADPDRRLAETLAELDVRVGQALTGALAALTQEDYKRARELTLAAHNGILELERHKPK